MFHLCWHSALTRTPKENEKNTHSPLNCLPLLRFLHDVTFRCPRVPCAPAAWALSSVNRSSGQLNSQSSGIRPSDVASPVRSSTGWVTHPSIPSFQILITGAFFHFQAAGNAFLWSQNTGSVMNIGSCFFCRFLFFWLSQKSEPWRWAANCLSPKTCLVFAWSTFFASVVICWIYYARFLIVFL